MWKSLVNNPLAEGMECHVSPIQKDAGQVARRLALPLSLFAILSICFGVVAVGIPVPSDGTRYAPETVVIPSRTFSYRADGDFRKAGFAVDAPLILMSRTAPLTIMKNQVTVAEYSACVREGYCQPAGNTDGEDYPVTGVSFDDATDYSRWLSTKTGMTWDLPTDAQLATAAGEDFPDDALGIPEDNTNPALRWIADYEREAAARPGRMKGRRQIGAFGENEFGLTDFGGNVWEWTSTCHRRVDVSISGAQTSSELSCGVYVTVGKHRSPMSGFVRDPKGGGCAVGTPPDNLGFRLVKDVSLISRMKRNLGNIARYLLN